MNDIQQFLGRLGPEGTLALVALFLILNFARGCLQMYVDRRDRQKIAQAATCNYPVDLVAPLREATMRQSVFAQQSAAAAQRVEDAVARMADAVERQTVQLIEALAELRAGRSRR